MAVAAGREMFGLVFLPVAIQRLAVIKNGQGTAAEFCLSL
jgi:hypothetical protein